MSMFVVEEQLANVHVITVWDLSQEIAGLVERIFNIQLIQR